VGRGTAAAGLLEGLSRQFASRDGRILNSVAGGKVARVTQYMADLLKDLKDPEYANLYLLDALESGSKEEFLMALRDVAEARAE
jgi:hypothetical protein